MSDCPVCHKKGRHVAVIVPRKPADAVGIVHECVTSGCRLLRWEERAENSLSTILRSFERDPEARPT